MYKKIYIEITNQCNLNCSFCIKNYRKIKYLSLDELKIILEKLKGQTKFLYFHVLGEPLIHPLFNYLVEEASKNYCVNITTNGYLIDNINTKKIRQLNISLHSYDEKYGLDVNEYINKIIKKCEQLSDTFISYRFWVNGKFNQQILDKINEYYNTQIKLSDLKGNFHIKDKIYISTDEEFIWPDLNNNINIKQGFCLAIKDHLGILVDGTVIPCCLDTKGDIKIGNIFNESMEKIIESERYQKLKNNFHKNQRNETLCQKCGYKINNKI